MKTSAHLRRVLSAIDVLYFEGQLEARNTTIKWFRPQVAQTQFLYGEVDLTTNNIRINSVLAHDWVPVKVVNNVVFHEICHIILGPDHTPYFHLLERQYPFFAEASIWEHESWSKLMKAERPLVRSLK